MLQILGVVGGIGHEHQLLDVELGHDEEGKTVCVASPGVAMDDVSMVLGMLVSDARVSKFEGVMLALKRGRGRQKEVTELALEDDIVHSRVRDCTKPISPHEKSLPSTSSC